MPPVLDPSKSKVDGLAFIGLSLTRKSDQGHPASVTHQTAFDLNVLQDRAYDYVFSTNDDGWLVGGGEPGPPTSYKLPAADSAHVEIMRIGTYRPDWGGFPAAALVQAIASGWILIPQIEVVPTAVVANGDRPPELEIRFDMEPTATDYFNACDAAKRKNQPLPPLPINWQLRFIHNQLFRLFQFPSRFCPGAFHSTILRKAEFRSEGARRAYFEKCAKAVRQWKEAGVQPLIAPSMDRKIFKVFPKPNLDEADTIMHEGKEKDEKKTESVVSRSMKAIDPEWKIQTASLAAKSFDSRYQSGLWLFTDRTNITHYFAPNFFPPYDTPEKRQFIMEMLRERWDERILSWIPVTESRFLPTTTSRRTTHNHSNGQQKPRGDDAMDEDLPNVWSFITGACRWNDLTAAWSKELDQQHNITNVVESTDDDDDERVAN